MYLDCQDQGRMAAVSTSVYEFDSKGTGHHIYKTVWITAIYTLMKCYKVEQEDSNIHNEYTVAIIK